MEIVRRGGGIDNLHVGYLIVHILRVEAVSMAQLLLVCYVPCDLLGAGEGGRGGVLPVDIFPYGKRSVRVQHRHIHEGGEVPIQTVSTICPPRCLGTDRSQSKPIGGYSYEEGRGRRV